jgi:hypothetical protein
MEGKKVSASFFPEYHMEEEQDNIRKPTYLRRKDVVQTAHFQD